MIYPRLTFYLRQNRDFILSGAPLAKINGETKTVCHVGTYTQREEIMSTTYNKDAETVAKLDTLTPQAESRLMEFTKSELFGKTFREGMDMVEETAAYLDGTGRHDSKKLARNDALTYASQSMRLTTRLMQVASWLLVQRALKEGEMSLAEARQDKYRLVPEIPAEDGLSFSDLAKDAYALPARLLDLLARSEQLYERIARLDRSLYGSIAAQKGNTVADQISRLEAAFGKVAMR